VTLNVEHKEIAQRVDSLDRKIDALIASVEGIRSDVAETKDIVAAWESVKLWAQFTKWAAGLGASLGALWLMAKHMLVGMVR